MNKLLLCAITLFVVNISVKAQAPAISYPGPNLFTYGVATDKISPTNTGGGVPTTGYGEVMNLAGGANNAVDGSGSNAGFNAPFAITADKNGNLFIAEQGTNRIRKITPAGVVSTFAGSGTAAFADGTGTAASFNNPSGIVADENDNLYVTDRYNYRIRKITPDGVVTTIAGSGSSGSSNGTGANASFNFPFGIAIDKDGNLIVADQVNCMIRKVTPAGVVTTIAGSGYSGYYNGTGTNAYFYYPTGVVTDAGGNIFVADNLNNVVRKITPDGVVSTLAGGNYAGYNDGTGSSAYFNQPSAITFDSFGNLLVGDQFNYRIRKISPDGIVSTLPLKYTNTIELYRPTGVLQINGLLYVVDYGNNLIRSVSLSGYEINKPLPDGLTFNKTTGEITGTPTALSPATIYTITATNPTGRSTTQVSIGVVIPALPPTITYISPNSLTGATLGITGTNLLGATSITIGGQPATNFRVISPTQISAIVPQGAVAGEVTVTNPYGTATKSGFGLLAAPSISYNTPQVYTTGTEITQLAINNAGGAIPPGRYGDMAIFAGSGTAGYQNGTGSAASFYVPAGITTDGLGNIYVADRENNVIRKITADGVVTRFAGAGGYNSSGSLDGTLETALFYKPTALSSDGAGNIYVVDIGNNTVRKIGIDGKVTTVGSLPYNTYLSSASMVADKNGNVYFTDNQTNVIKKMDAQGVVTTFAGNGSIGKVNGSALTASFSRPDGIAIDKDGNIYIADSDNKLVRKISTAGQVSTVADLTADNVYGLNYITVDKDGTIFLASQGYNLIYKITLAGTISKLAIPVEGVYTFGLAIDDFGSLYISNASNNSIMRLSLTGFTITPALPKGLSMNSSGTISGTPLETSPATDYSVTTTNAAGNSVATLNIGVQTPALPAVITSVKPAEVSAGAKAIITGDYLFGATSVKIGTTEANYAVLSPTQIAITVPQGASGNLSITNPYGTATSSALKINSPPAITYAGSASFTIGEQIANLSPVNSGTAVPNSPLALTTTFVGGSNNLYLGLDGTGTAASLVGPSYIATDAAGNIYITDYYYIRKVSPEGVVSTLAGSSENSGSQLQPLVKTPLSNPKDIAVDLAGNVYYVSQSTNTIKKISPDGILTTYAENKNGGAQAINYPLALAINSKGVVFFSDYFSIGKIEPNGDVTLVAGGNFGSANGTGSNAGFNFPTGLAFDANDNLYVADQNNQLIRKVSPTGEVTTLAGSGISGKADGIGTSASFNNPGDIAVDGSGNVFVSERGNNTIRMITPDGLVTTLAGNGDNHSVDGTGTSASFNSPAGLVADDAGNLIVVDANSRTLRKVAITGYSISPALPAGLLFNSATGIISGTPEQKAAAQVYQVTALNLFGKSTANVSIEVKIPEVKPTITSISPTSAAAGQTVTVSGTYFDGTTAVEIGGKPATGFQIISSTLLSVKIPAAATGSDVKITNPYGTATFSGFSFITPPAITYNPTQIYYTGVPITPLTVTKSGGEIPDNIFGQTTTVSGTPNSYYNLSGGVVKDAANNIYFADRANQTIKKIDPTGVISTFAGSGNFGSENGTGTAASFKFPDGLAIDAAGNLYVAEAGGNLIRKITPGGVVTTLAGSGTPGSINGVGTAASFNAPRGLTIDAAGNLYVADAVNYQVRKVTPNGTVTTIAGAGVFGNTNGPAATAKFGTMAGITTDGLGNIYVSETSNTIRLITAEGMVSTFAGTGESGNQNGPVNSATFNNPIGLATDRAGNIYVADQDNHLIRKITPAGVVSTLAGSGQAITLDGLEKSAGIKTPYGIFADATGNIYVAEASTLSIRKVAATGYSVSPQLPEGFTLEPNGAITGAAVNVSPATNYTITGIGQNGTATATTNIKVELDRSAPIITAFSPAQAGQGAIVLISGTSFTGTTEVKIGGVAVKTFNVLSPVAIAAVVDAGTASGSVTVTTPYGTVSKAGFTISPAPKITYPANLSFENASTITPVSPTSSGSEIPANVHYQVSTIAGNQTTGSTNGTGAASRFNNTQGVTVDPSGNIYIAETSANQIRKITPDGTVSTLAGSSFSGSANGTGTAASFYYPQGIISDFAGNLYVTDAANNLIRKITPEGVVSTFAGNGIASTLDGKGINASFNRPGAICIDFSGNLYVSEISHIIRKITPAGVVSTFAGSTPGFDNGTGAAAKFNNPSGLAADHQGNIFVADAYNSVIRKITPEGVVTTYAGSATGNQGYQDGAALSATFTTPTSLAIDAEDNIYVSERGLIRVISKAGKVSTVAGINNRFGGTDGIGTAATFSQAAGMAIDADGNLIVSDFSRIRKIVLTGYTIDKALPDGLVLNSATGVLSGSPLREVSATPLAYNITAKNANGSSTTSLSFQITLPAKPAISYSSSQTYTAGTKITPLAPASTGGSVPALGYGKTTTLAGTGSSITKDTVGDLAGVYYPAGLTFDGDGNIILAEDAGSAVRRITLDGVVSTIAGKLGGYSTLDGPVETARFNEAIATAVDSKGNIYVTEAETSGIRKIANGMVTTLALTGNGTNLPQGLWGITIDGSDNLYVSDRVAHNIKKVTPAGVVSILAGGTAQGYQDAVGTAARFYRPNLISYGTDGNVYVSDTRNHLIRRILPNGTVQTVAGTPGVTGHADGPAGSATFYSPVAVTQDGAGNLYLADYDNNAIRKIDINGVVSTVAGNGKIESVDGVGITASFNHPVSVLASKDGSILYVSDLHGNKVRKIELYGYSIDKLLPDGLLFDSGTGTISGTPTKAFPETTYTISARNVTGVATATVKIKVDAVGAPQISYPAITNFTVDAAITPLTPVNTGGAVPAIGFGKTATFAGNVTASSADGTTTAAGFNNPLGLAFDKAGNLFVADQLNNKIRKITPEGVVSSFAGSGVTGTENGRPSTASFNGPTGLTIDQNGYLYVTDRYNNLIRTITPAGVVSNINYIYYYPPASSTATTYMYSPYGVVSDDANKFLYVSDSYSHVIRKMEGQNSTIFAGMGGAGFVNGTLTQAKFNNPSGLAMDALGNIYVADQGNNAIRKITPAGVVSTYAGTGSAGKADGPAASATFSSPTGLAFDVNGNLYVADMGNNTIRVITKTGVVFSVAGGLLNGSADGAGTVATFKNPASIAIDASGMLFVSDQKNQLIRTVNPTGYVIDKSLPKGLSLDDKTGIISGTPVEAMPATAFTITAFNYGGASSTTITLKADAPPLPAISYNGPYKVLVNAAISTISPSNTGGQIPAPQIHRLTTIAGGMGGTADGTGTNAQFLRPVAVTSDKAGNLYVIDDIYGLVRKITPAGVVTTIAGSTNFSNTNLSAGFRIPLGIVADATGNLFVADTYNNRIAKVTQAGVISTFAGDGNLISKDGTGSGASFENPSAITIDDAGNLYVVESQNFNIRKVTPGGVVTTLFSNMRNQQAFAQLAPGIVKDAAGNFYVSDYQAITKIKPDGSKYVLAGNYNRPVDDGRGVVDSFGALHGLAIDAGGNLFAADRFAVKRVSPDGVITTIVGSLNWGGADGIGAEATLDNVYGITFNPDGHLIITEQASNTIRKIVSTGYSVSPALPEGLRIDAASGLITGKPAAITPAADYTVRATNFGGTNTTKVNIEVFDNAAPTITLTPIPTLTYGDADVVIQATSSNNNPQASLVYKIDNYNVANFADGKLHILAAGTFTLTISQPGDEQHGAATDVTQQITVLPREITIAANTATKTYGEADGELAYTISGGVLPADALTGKLSRAAGEQAGTYAISQGSLAINPNYNITYTTADLTIIPKAVTITANAQTKVYGDADPALSYALTNGSLTGTDTFTGKLSRATGESTGTYAIGLGTLALNTNYQVTYAGADLSITPKPVTITANPQTKVYGGGDPELSYTLSNGSLIGTDVFTGNLNRAAGEKKGVYAIGLGNLALSTNYQVTYAGADLTISPMAITVAANSKTKVYGDAEPELTYAVTTGHLISPDAFTGTLVRDAGENTGTYAIKQGNLALNGNYTLIYTAGELKITTRQLTITADNQSRRYGLANQPLTFKYSGFVNGDNESKLLAAPAISTVATTQSVVGNYDISVSGASANNYHFNYVKGILSVTKAPLTITAVDVFRTYGKENPAFAVTYSGFVNGESSTALTTLPVVSTTASVNSAEGVYNLVPAGAVSANYSFSYVNGKLTVTVPVTNIKVSAISATCRNQNDGSISIDATRNLNYTATMAGQTYAFTNKLVIGNLAAGSYTVCVTADGVADYNQCFTVKVTEPQDLSVYAVVNKQVNTVTLNLSGSDNYTIVLNGKTYQTKNKNITLPLSGKSNKLTVNGDKLCQGVVEKDIAGADNMVPYPNPFNNVVYLNLGETVQAECVVKIVNMTDGKVKVMQKFMNQSGIIQLDVSSLNLGVYALQLSMDNNKQAVYKIIKR